ncbi:MAG: OmpA family protein [Paludibacteraceae bacterium]|nr:OmpA family protein [Paludibacteraceae bacterium]
MEEIKSAHSGEYVSASEIAGAKVRVYGKAQNRTALGIIHAYHVMYPHAKFEDFEKAFPTALNPDSGWNMNFKKAAECKTDNEKGFWFTDEKEETINLQDGTKIAVVKMWTKPSFERLVNHAKQYGIVVADFEKADKGIGKKGGFRLEYLNGYVPPVPAGGKSKTWLWILIAAIIIILALIFFLIRSCNKQPQVVEVEKVVTESVIVHDTLYLQQIEDIEKDFNAAQFQLGKADLSDDAKFVLHDLAKIMQKNPDIHLKIEGHTSAEGNASFNQQLSENRAKAAVDFLVEHEGIDASRLDAEGCGSSKPKNAEDPMASENRRTEFIVLE